jgi:hypothetical protein
MAPIHDVQTSFAGGEVAPTVQARIDIAKYKSSLKTCRNAIPSPHGSVSNRPGTYFAAMSKFTNKKSRLIPFVFSEDQAYILEFGDRYIRFFKDGGLILEDAYDYTVPTWDAQINYSVDDYVLASGIDGPHLFKSIKYFNLGYAPLISPTYWEDMGYVDPWDVGETYSTDDVVSRVRESDGKSKTFISLIDNNLGIDPLNQETPWILIEPNWDDETTYAVDDYVVIVKNDDHFRFRSLQNDNTGHYPETSPTWWDLDIPFSWDSEETYAEDDWVLYDIQFEANSTLWENDKIYSTGKKVFVFDDGEPIFFVSLQNGNFNNDPLNPITWWTVPDLPGFSPFTTYALDEIVLYSSGNQGRYKSLQNGNLAHYPPVSPTWWELIPTDAWDDETTYSIGDYATYLTDDDWVIVRVSSQNDNLNHNPKYSTWWAEMSAPSYNFRLYQSGIDNNLNHNPANPYEGAAWEEVYNLTSYEVETPYLEADLPLLKFAQSADTLYLVHPNHKPVLLQRISDNEWTLTDYAFVNGPFRFPNTDPDLKIVAHTPVDGVTQVETNAVDFFDPDHVGAYFKLSSPATGISTALSVVADSAVHYSNPIKCNGNWRLMTTGSWKGDLTLEKSIDGGTTWTQIDQWFGNNDTNINTYGSEKLETDRTLLNNGAWFLLRVKISFSSSSTWINISLNADGFMQEGLVQITDYVNAQHVVANVIDEVASYGSYAQEWAEGAWSEYRGWPGTISFCQDRLFFGGNESDPQTIWATKSGNYVDFGRSDPLVDSDGITVNLTSRELNKIKSLRALLNSLIAFTESSEYSLSADAGGPITPTSVITKMQGSRGCGSSDPVMIGNRIIFDSPKGSSLRDMLFQVLSDSFESEDISIISNHLLKGFSIVEMAYQQEPDSILWMVRSDGKLLSLTYMREQEMLAWAWHDTDGLFESVCTIPGDDINDVWFIVNRDGRRYIEKMTQRIDSTDPADQYFVDCGISYDGSPVSALTGYDHLNDMTVAINADGFVLAQQVVVNGTITLEATGDKTTYSKVHIGLPFISDIETLNPEIPLREGPQFGRKYSINKVQFRFLNSRGGWIGADADNLTDEINQRDESLDTEDATPLFSGYDAYTLPQGEDARGHVMYRQVDPMPFTILGIASIIDVGENP